MIGRPLNGFYPQGLLRAEIGNDALQQVSGLDTELSNLRDSGLTLTRFLINPYSLKNSLRGSVFAP